MSELFLLAGNAKYHNRGCEAIVRGTMTILRKQFGAETRCVATCFGLKDDGNETDSAISYVPTGFGRFSMPWLLHQCDRRLGMKLDGQFLMLRKATENASASIQVGGDNYSLDYGFPEWYFSLDSYLLRRGMPVYLWGASVGPFEGDSRANEAYKHLNTLSGIFVRETRSLEYLRKHGVGRVRLVADPAFAMSAEMPPASYLPSVDLGSHPIGVNFSPLMARFVTGGDLQAWKVRCVRTVIAIMRKAGENIILIPHVFQPGNDDGDLLNGVADQVARETGTRVGITNRELSAAQIKWVISQCKVFVGARTHATIAAFSSCVPTLSLAYSVKARGLNQDIFGNLDYCLDPPELQPDMIANRTGALISEAPKISEYLARRIPGIVEKAFIAGDYLAESLVSRRHFNSDKAKA